MLFTFHNVASLFKVAEADLVAPGVATNDFWTKNGQRINPAVKVMSTIAAEFTSLINMVFKSNTKVLR